MSRKNSIENEQLTDTAYYILLCLTKPSHGYALMGKIQSISSGEFTVGPASMYTNLKKLLEARLVELIEDDKKTYQLTTKGMELLMSEYERRRKIVSQSQKTIERLRGESTI